MVMVYRRVLAACALGEEEEEPFLVVDDQVVAQARLLAKPLLALRQEFVERHGEVMILDENLPLEVEPWQQCPPLARFELVRSPPCWAATPQT